ncbi:helix-turn-helix transcriptional regulator [Devosia sp.]|uniref:helix-turn-helix domain-containing protein n=1 Tax=Devosia sp. TaxID=1871048 RepID=UPI0026043312|nr:helix-turn-helix transcriptional regulator [Devosia sp.]
MSGGQGDAVPLASSAIKSAPPGFTPCRSLADASPDAGLSARQVDVMHLTAQGKSNKDIAQALGLAEVTVKVHVNALFRNLNITTEPKRPR